jgi:cellulose synthase/poly-beta-1,6-N-acetylglucosamine synthase-like glycosyltransferase
MISSGLFWSLVATYVLVELIPGLISFFPRRIRRKSEGFRPLSIILPIKNEEELIQTIIDSWLNVAYPASYELIFVDQGNDKSGQIIRENQKRYPKIRYIHVEANKLSAELIGVREAKNDLIVINDGDKLPQPGLLQKIVPALEDPSIGAAFGGTVPDRAHNIIQLLTGLELTHKYVDQRFASVVDSPTYLSLSGAVIRRALLKNLPPSNLIADDVYFALAIRKDGYRIIYVPGVFEKEGVVADLSDIIRKRLRVSSGTGQVAFTNYNDMAFSPKYGLFGTIVLPIRQIYFFLGNGLVPLFFAALLIELLLGVVTLGQAASFLGFLYALLLVIFLVRLLSIRLVVGYRNFAHFPTTFLYPLYYLLFFRFLGGVGLYRLLFGHVASWEKTLSDRVGRQRTK